MWHEAFCRGEGVIHPVLYVAIASALVGGIACSFVSCSLRAERPNILLLIVDTLRADRLGIHGQKKRLTPHIDALSQDALTFPNAIAASSSYSPTVLLPG